MPKPGRIGRYEVLGLLGHGGMGAVYKAHDPVLDRYVAVKLISPVTPTATGSDESLERFRREARAAGRLSHPNIVAVHDMDVEEATGAPFIVMEYVDGISLSAVLGENPTMPLAQALEITEQVGAALVEAHRHGIVHRDIKPGNVFLDSRGRVKVGDFGIARVQGSDLTQSGVALGTPGYLAPEVLHGAPADVRSDVFALGVLAYQLLAGKKPFDGPTPTSITLQVLQRDPEPLQTLRPEIPAHVSAAVVRALDKSPATRTATVAGFLSELHTESIPIAVETVPVAAPTGRSGRGLVLLGAIAGALVFSLGSFLAMRGCARGPGVDVASPRTTTPASVLADEPTPTKRSPTPSRSLPPVSTRASTDSQTREGDAQPREHQTEPLPAWVRDRLDEVLAPASGAGNRSEERTHEDEKREEKERASREKERDNKGKGKSKGRGKGHNK